MCMAWEEDTLIEMFAPPKQIKRDSIHHSRTLVLCWWPAAAVANNKQDHQHLVAVVQFPTHLFPMPFVTIRHTTLANPNLLSKIWRGTRLFESFFFGPTLHSARCSKMAQKVHKLIFHLAFFCFWRTQCAFSLQKILRLVILLLNFDIFHKLEAFIRLWILAFFWKFNNKHR